MDQASQLEDLIERNLQNSGQSPKLLTDMQDARTQIAKISDARKALNDTTSNIDATAYGRIADAKPGVLTGGAQKVAQFAQQFPKAATPAEKIGHFGADYGDALLSFIMHAKNFGTGALSLGVRPAMRSALLSDPVQSLLTVRPNYGPGMVKTALQQAVEAQSNPLAGLTESSLGQQQ